MLERIPNPMSLVENDNSTYGSVVITKPTATIIDKTMENPAVVSE